MKPAYLLLLLACLGSLGTRAQNFFWDFEGPNGLNGWHNHDGTPLQSATGAASSTSLWIQTGPPVGAFDSSAFIYHVLPYDPSVFYHLTFWQQTPNPDVLIRAYVAWIDTLSLPVTLNAVNANVMTSGNSTWHFVEMLDVLPVSGVGAYCLCLTASSPGTGVISFDNVSVEMVPQTSVMMRTPMFFLGGPFIDGSNQMNWPLSDQGLLPLTEPYTALGYPQVGGGGGEWCTPMVAHPSALHHAVDWVRMELRSAADPTVVVATRQLMLTFLGITCGYNGQWMISFDVPPGNYYIAVRHRNHLSVMTATPVSLSHNTYGTLIDFRSSSLVTWGTDARKTVGAYRALWPGDANGNGQVKYTGTGNDRDVVLQAIGGIVPTNTLNNVYDRRDLNLNGQVKYTGFGNDRDLILQTIGVVPTNVRVQQLP